MNLLPWKLLTCTVLCAGAMRSSALIQEEGSGILYGKHPAFMIKAPSGWMFDNESGAANKVFAVMYPKGKTWENSDTVAYAQTRPLTEKIKTAADAVKDTVAQFHKNGSPEYRSEAKAAIKLDGGKEAAIYHFTGDKWGNYEAAAYFVEEGWIHYLVLNCKSEDAFKKALPGFEAIVKSYLLIGKVEIEGEKDDTDAPAKKEGKEKKAETKDGKTTPENPDKAKADKTKPKPAAAGDSKTKPTRKP